MLGTGLLLTLQILLDQQVMSPVISVCVVLPESWLRADCV